MRTSLWIGFALLTSSRLVMSQSISDCRTTIDQIVAAPASKAFHIDASHPLPDWQKAKPITFCSDWQGKNLDPGLETSVRALWSDQMLYLRFECRFKTVTVFDDSEANGRRDKLWE